MFGKIFATKHRPLPERVEEHRVDVAVAASARRVGARKCEAVHSFAEDVAHLARVQIQSAERVRQEQI